MSENKKVIDQGGAYRFEPDFTTCELPPGVYYPDYDPNGNFILTESANFPDNDNPDIAIETDTPFDQIVVEENIPSWEELKEKRTSGKVNDSEVGAGETNPQEDNSELRTDEIDADWVNDGYFELEEYNPQLYDANANIDQFLQSKKYYEKNGIDYRRSLLFYGEPGGGKSQFVSNKSYELVRKLNAVVIRLETHSHVEVFASDGMREIADGIPNRFKVVVLEELSEVTQHDQIRQHVVNILDSNQLRDNVLFMATTNEPEKLPKNFVDRPGRLDFLHGVHSKDNDPAYIPKFYEHLIGEEYPVDNEEWTKKVAEELTPAYVKGLFITAKERNETLEKTYERIKKRRELVKNNFSETSIGF